MKTILNPPNPQTHQLFFFKNYQPIVTEIEGFAYLVYGGYCISLSSLTKICEIVSGKQNQPFSRLDPNENETLLSENSRGYRHIPAPPDPESAEYGFWIGCEYLIHGIAKILPVASLALAVHIVQKRFF